MINNLGRLNANIAIYILGEHFVSSPSYVTDGSKSSPETALLLSRLGKVGYCLILQKDISTWLFTLWKVGRVDLACTVHGNSIEEVLYDAMVMLVHQTMETKNV